MSTPTTSEYMLLFRGNDWHKGLSPEQIEEAVKQMYAWLDRLTAEGKAKAGKPLFPEGKIVSQKKGRSVADGPFAEPPFGASERSTEPDRSRCAGVGVRRRGYVLDDRLNSPGSKPCGEFSRASL